MFNRNKYLQLHLGHLGEQHPILFLLLINDIDPNVISFLKDYGSIVIFVSDALKFISDHIRCSKQTTILSLIL